MNGFWIILENSGGEIDRSFANTEEEARLVAAEIISGVANLQAGDTLRVIEGWQGHYQITQDRFENGSKMPTRDVWPVLFGSIEDARAAVARQGVRAMFEHGGGAHDACYITELDKDCIATGATYSLLRK